MEGTGDVDHRAEGGRLGDERQQQLGEQEVAEVVGGEGQVVALRRAGRLEGEGRGGGVSDGGVAEAALRAGRG